MLVKEGTCEHWCAVTYLFPNLRCSLIVKETLTKILIAMGIDGLLLASNKPLPSQNHMVLIFIFHDTHIFKCGQTV